MCGSQNANMAAFKPNSKGDYGETLEFKKLTMWNSTKVWSLLAASEKPRKLACIDLLAVFYFLIVSNSRQEEIAIMYFFMLLQECVGMHVYYRCGINTELSVSLSYIIITKKNYILLNVII